VAEALAVIRQAFREKAYTISPNSPRLIIRRQVKSKIKSMLIIFFLYFPKATTGLVAIGYRGVLLSSLLQVNVHVTHSLLNVLVQIANKMGSKKNSLTSRGLFTKNSSWQAEQSIPHTALTFCGYCKKICEDFSPNFGDKRTGCCITTTHSLTRPFSAGNFFTKNNMAVVPN
jgi:hypothetical protein